jgi:HEAT repeat protein
MMRWLIVLAAAAALAAGCSDKSKQGSSPADERTREIEAAARAGDDKAVEKIAPLVRHEDAQTATAAVTALARMASPKACETLQQVVLADTRPEVRRAAVAGLSQRTEPRAVEAISQAMVRDVSPEVRSDAALGLARAGTVKDVPTLANAVESEQDPKVARTQVLAMERLIGVRLPRPDPRLSPAERRAALQRLRNTALNLAEAKKNHIPRGSCKDNPR